MITTAGSTDQLAIPDNDPAGASQSITVSDSLIIDDLDVRDWIASLPDGLDGRVGERGYRRHRTGAAPGWS